MTQINPVCEINFFSRYEINIDDYEFIINGMVVTSKTKLVRSSGNNEILTVLSKPLRNIIYAFTSLKGEVLTKEQIKEIGWPKKPISDSSVLVAISEIRYLLGDSKIVTIVNEGYVYI